jgi:biopolymer transport protein ExbD
MSWRASQGRSARNIVNCDLELRPLMNVFIVLIPMLLMSAVFLEIRVIDLSMPQAADAAETRPVSAPLRLALRIVGDRYVLEGDGIASMEFTREVVTRHAKEPGGTVSAQLTAQLAQIAAAHPGTKGIRIVAEPGTHYQEIVALMDLARAAGLPDAELEGAPGGA